MATKSQAVTICWKQKDHKNLPHSNRPSFQGFSIQNQKEFETFKFKQKEIFPNRQPRWQFWYGNVVRMTENKFPLLITSLWNPNQFQPCSSCENNSENLQIQRDRKRQKKNSSLFASRSLQTTNLCPQHLHSEQTPASSGQLWTSSLVSSASSYSDHQMPVPLDLER